jgi:type I restriction enzyme S subunit
VPGDVLFARIEPSIFNKKYVYVEHLFGHPYAYVSTEFYVVKARPESALQLFLYAILFSRFVEVQIRGKTTGSSGRRRLDKALFADLTMPVPPFALQAEIAEAVSGKRVAARQLRDQANQNWAAAKRELERTLLGTTAD